MTKISQGKKLSIILLYVIFTIIFYSSILFGIVSYEYTITSASGDNIVWGSGYYSEIAGAVFGLGFLPLFIIILVSKLKINASIVFSIINCSSIGILLLYSYNLVINPQAYYTNTPLLGYYLVIFAWLGFCFSSFLLIAFRDSLNEEKTTQNYESAINVTAPIESPPEFQFQTTETENKNINPEKNIFCRMCGARNRSDDTFCTQCGFELLSKPRTPESEKELFEKLAKLLKISTKVKISDISELLKMKRSFLIEKLIDWSDRMAFELDGDYLLMPNDSIDNFIDALDEQFALWKNSESSQDGKI